MSRRPDQRTTRPQLELLEVRSMLSVAPLYYSVTGAGNNLTNPNWGSANSDLLQTIPPPQYGDGISTPAGQNLPSARLISNVVGSQTGDVLDSRDLSAFTYAWGQFIDHDLDLTPDGGASDPIAVPSGDPQFDPNGTGTQTLPFTRSVIDATTGTSASNPLDQMTVVTSFLDGSMIYGSDATRAAALRTFAGGQLKTSAGDLLPFNITGLPNSNSGPYPYSDMFLAGDVRANENIELTSLQVLFMREHNRQADILAKVHPTWTDEQLYQGARQIVIAEIQSITFNEFLPALLGQNAIAPYKGYNSSANPGITPEFSEAAYRFGHSQLDDDVQFFNNNGSNFSFTYTLPDGTQMPVNSAADVADGDNGMPLVDAFFSPFSLEQPGVEGSILKYLSSDVAQAVDTQMVDSVRNVLFGAPGSGAGGQDLFALDIQRGRDVGLPTYNEARVDYGLKPVTSFSQITSDPTLQADLKSMYGNVNNVELFVGGLAENHAPGSSVGSTFQAIIANQFDRIRDGDRLWYQNSFKGSDLAKIQNTTLADIIRENTSLTNIQSNVFVFQTAITGQVSLSLGNIHLPKIGPLNLAGLTVQLEDSSGDVIESTQATRDGSYTFKNVPVGSYQVVLLPPAFAQSSTLSQPVSITRGGTVGGLDFHLHVTLKSLAGFLGGWADSNGGSGNGNSGHAKN